VPSFDCVAFEEIGEGILAGSVTLKFQPDILDGLPVCKSAVVSAGMGVENIDREIPQLIVATIISERV